jgi:hypothetical protein
VELQKESCFDVLDEDQKDWLRKAEVDKAGRDVPMAKEEPGFLSTKEKHLVLNLKQTLDLIVTRWRQRLQLGYRCKERKVHSEQVSKG